MLSDLDETIRELLKAEIPIKNGEIDIKFEQPKREWSAKLTRPTINLYLYDVRENATLRHHGWEGKPRNGRPLTATKKRFPYRFDCSYMMTVWANEPEDEHNLLARTMLALLRFPIIPEQLLLGSIQNQPFDVQARVGVHDKLTNPAEVWGSLDNEIRPTVPYIITLALDPWTEIDGPVVKSFTIRSGQAEGLPWRPTVPEENVAWETTFIGGIVTDKSDKPRSGIEVALKGTGFFATTDDEGRFTIGGVRPGDYTLIAWPAKGRPKQQKITIPSKTGEYNLQF